MAADPTDYEMARDGGVCGRDGVTAADITKPPVTAPRSPPIDQRLQILCEDHVGRYVIPFLCRWRDGIWENAITNRRIEATVVGWREPIKNSVLNP